MDGADGVLCATSRQASDINYGALTMAVRSDDRNRSRLDIVPGKHARGGDMYRETALLNALKFEPSERWLAEALLVSPKVSTLTGPSWPEFGERLFQEDLWEPASPEDLGSNGLSTTVNEAVRVFEINRAKTDVLSKKMQARGRSWLFESKLGPDMAELLIDTGHASRSRTDGTIVGDAALIDTFLYLSGRNLAEKKDWHLDVSSAAESQVALAPLSPSADEDESYQMSDATECALLGLRDGVPSLAPGVGLDQVIAFRKQEEDSFGAFRAGLDQLVAASAPEGDHVAQLRIYNAILDDFAKAGRSFGVRMRMETKYLVLPLKTWASVWGQDGKLGTRILAATTAALAAYDLVGDVESVVTQSPQGMATVGIGLTLAVVLSRRNCPYSYLAQAAKQGLTAK